MFMKNICKIISALYLILACFACEKLLVDISGEPDMVVENRLGLLHFFDDDYKKWGVRYHYPDTHDNVDWYIIVDMNDRNFPFSELKEDWTEVSVSGFCYRIPDNILHEKGIPLLGGMKHYYIKVTELKLE